MKAFLAVASLWLAACPLLAQPAAAPDLPTIDVWGDFPRVDADAPFRPLAWPMRASANGEGLGVVVAVTQPILRPEGRRIGVASPARLVAEVPDAAALLGDSPWRVLTEGVGAFVVAAEPRPEGERIPRRMQNLADLTFRFVSARHEGPDLVRIERTWFAYFTPQNDPPEATPLGVVLLMPGMFGTPEPVLSGLTADLRKRGLGVLRMIAQPGRFTEQLTVTLDPAGDLPAQLAPAVQEFDSREAECAYAAEAAWAHLAVTRPETATLPKAVVGFSAGAITLPTVVARNPGRYAATVAVGGGCHWWLLNEKSNYRTLIDAIDVSWAGPPGEPHLAAARNAYLAASTLDPYNTAQSLRGKPTIFIQGRSDLAVPSPLGDCLWERAGKPERWLVDGGHEVLFMQLTEYRVRIGEWLVTRLREAGAPAEGTP